MGTINPTSGDASIFQPLEQTVLTQTIEPRRRTALFARYSVIGSLAGAAGVLAAAIPDIAAASYGLDRVAAIRAMFVAYGLFGVASLLVFRPLTSAVEAKEEAPKAPLGESRRLVYGIAALFGMDSLGTGFLVHYSLRVSSFTKSEEHELSVECRGSPHRRDQFHNGFGWKVGFHHFEGVQSQCATITVKVRASQWLSVSRSGGG
jgi:hypothetical protein